MSMKPIYVGESSPINNTTALLKLKSDINRYPMMTPEEEVLAFQELRATEDEKERREIINKIINANLRFALSISQKFSRNGDKVAELVSLATIGMEKAAKKFDYTKGFKFISQAVYWIRAEFTEYFRTENNLVRRSNASVIGTKDKQIAERFWQTEHREPTEEELIEALEAEFGITIRNRVDVIRVHTKSIDEKINGEDESTFADTAEFGEATASRNEYEAEMDNEQLKFVVSRLMPMLTIKEQDIIKKSFGIDCEPMDAEAIAEEYDYTAERIRQIIRGALVKMRSKAKKLMAM